MCADPDGLTFVRWKPKQGEILVVNSYQVRAMQGPKLKLDFKLVRAEPSRPQPQVASTSAAPKRKSQRKQRAHAVNGDQHDPNQRWMLDALTDREVRKVCEAT